MPNFVLSAPSAVQLLESIAQLDVPVGQIDKVSPALVLLRREGDVHERPPLRTLRFANQRHMRFMRQPISLSRITRMHEQTTFSHAVVPPRSRGST